MIRLLSLFFFKGSVPSLLSWPVIFKKHRHFEGQKYMNIYHRATSARRTPPKPTHEESILFRNVF